MEAPVPSDTSVAALLVTRDLLLELVDLCRGTFDPVDAVILQGAVQANVSPILANIDLQFRFGPIMEVPPDSARRPVSITGLAGALGLPFETVRRRLARMSDAGICDIGPAGVVIPDRYLGGPAHEATLQAVDSVLRLAWRELSAQGFFDLDPLPAPVREPCGPPMLRAQARIAGEYLIRLIPQIGQHFGGLIPGLIAIQLLRENTDGLDRTRTGHVPDGGAAWFPDPLKRPVSVTRVATVLRLQHETVRRHILRLRERGLVGQVGRGYILLAAGLDEIGIVEVVPENNVSLRRLFRDLARIGAVEAWATAEVVAQGPGSTQGA